MPVSKIVEQQLGHSGPVEFHAEVEALALFEMEGEALAF
jgi:hypothetical protein